MTNEAVFLKPSPFKFLDPYGPEDGEIFFGRKAEVAELYAKLYSSPITVVYGESGTGKTSLIQCGLRNRIPLEDMLFVSVRTAGNPEAALRLALLKAVPQISDGGEDLGDLLRRVIRRSYKTVLLVFDQFEEFLLFQTEEVRHHFAAQLADWLEQGLNLRMLFAIRQEFLAPLTALEETLPGLYDNRLWLRRMSREQAGAVITGPCDKAGVLIAPDLVRSLLDALNTSGQGIDLPTLQVVLDRLYQHAVTTSETAPVLCYEDYQALGQIHSILARFLDERIAALGEQTETAKQVLKTLVTAEATRRPATQEDIARRLARDFHVKLSSVDSTALLETLVKERILHEDPDRHCYELRHDSLAPHVRSWMSVLEQELEVLLESLEQRFREFQRNQRLLDAPFLADLAPYEGRLTLEDEMAKFVQSSKDALQREAVRQREQETALKKKRQRVIVGVAGAFFLVFAGFGGFSFVQWQKAQANFHKTRQLAAEAERQKQQAKANFHTAGQLMNDFYTLISDDDLFNAPGLEHLRRQLLEKAQKYSEELSQQRTLGVGTRLELANVTSSVAKMRQLFGESQNAEADYRKSIVLYEALVREHPEVSDYQNRLAESLNSLGSLQKNSGDAARAGESYHMALDIYARLVKDHPADPRYQNGLAKCLTTLGNLQKDSGDAAGAGESFHKALDIRERLVKDHPDVDYRNGLAWSLNSLGNLQKDSGDAAGAGESLHKALDIRERLVKDHPADPRYQNGLASNLNNLGNLQKDIGDTAGARESFHKALDICERLVKKHPDVPNYQNGLAESLNSLGNLQKDSGDAAGARESFHKALDIYERLVEGHPDVPNYQNGLAESHNNLGGLQEKSGDLTGARESFKQAAESYGRLAQKYAYRTAYRRDWAAAEERLVWVELLDRKPQAAIAAATRTLEIDPKQIWIKAKLAHGLLFDGQYAAALAIYTENQGAKLDGGKIFAQAVLNDFKKLRAKGITNPDMAKIKKLLSGAAPQKH